MVQLCVHLSAEVSSAQQLMLHPDLTHVPTAGWKAMTAYTSNPEACKAVLIIFLLIKRSHCPRTVVVEKPLPYRINTTWAGGDKPVKPKSLYRLKYYSNRQLKHFVKMMEGRFQAVYTVASLFSPWPKSIRLFSGADSDQCSFNKLQSILSSPTTYQVRDEMIKMYITQYNPSRAGQLRHRRVEDEKQERTEFNIPSLEVC